MFEFRKEEDCIYRFVCSQLQGIGIGIDYIDSLLHLAWSGVIFLILSILSFFFFPYIYPNLQYMFYYIPLFYIFYGTISTFCF